MQIYTVSDINTATNLWDPSYHVFAVWHSSKIKSIISSVAPTILADNKNENALFVCI